MYKVLWPASWQNDTKCTWLQNRILGRLTRPDPILILLGMVPRFFLSHDYMQNWINIAKFQRFKWKHTMCQLAKHLIFPAAATGLSCLMELTSSKIHSLIPQNLPKYPAQNCPNSSSSHSEKNWYPYPPKKNRAWKTQTHTNGCIFFFKHVSGHYP